MNAIFNSRVVPERLARAVNEAKNRAASLGRPVLASATIEVDVMVPQGCVPASDYFYWEQPSRDVSILALGDAYSVVAQGADRFDVVRSSIRELFADGVAEGGTPIALGGFSFDPMPSDDGLWDDYPDALVTVPRLLLSRSNGRRSLTVNLLVGPSSDLKEMLSSASSETAAFLKESRAVGAQHAGARRPTQVASCSPTSERGHWLDAVSSLTDAIAAGEAEKVVLARRLDVQSQRPFLVEAVIDRLRERYPECTIFAVRRGDACFLGATPETLVRLDRGTVSTDCLAGSARRGATEDEDRALGDALLADNKERREHAFVADALTEALAGVCTDVRAPQTPRLRRMANVQHLHTPIEASAPAEVHVLDLVERLHPTPATGGLPRERALSLIREHEAFSRGWYAGPIGWIDADGNGEFAVALRSALIRGNEASLFAGCGIVRGSDPEREYQESKIKLEAMVWALGATG